MRRAAKCWKGFLLAAVLLASGLIAESDERANDALLAEISPEVRAEVTARRDAPADPVLAEMYGWADERPARRVMDDHEGEPQLVSGR